MKTRKGRHEIPFLNFEPLVERSLLEIRQEFELLTLRKSRL
ncbi:MAG: hypothetical protein WBA93_28775 [Microcoleaceae cyanobacterium]